MTIYGAPTTKKNSQRIFRNRKTGRPFVMQSEQSVTWQESAVTQLRAQWRQPPLDVPVTMRAVVYRAKATGDLLNYLAAISDALEHAGVVVNDKLIVSLDGCRMLVDRENPRVEVEVTPIACEPDPSGRRTGSRARAARGATKSRG